MCISNTTRVRDPLCCHRQHHQSAALPPATACWAASQCPGVHDHDTDDDTDDDDDNGIIMAGHAITGPAAMVAGHATAWPAMLVATSQQHCPQLQPALLRASTRDAHDDSDSDSASIIMVGHADKGPAAMVAGPLTAGHAGSHQPAVLQPAGFQPALATVSCMRESGRHSFTHPGNSGGGGGGDPGPGCFPPHTDCWGELLYLCSRCVGREVHYQWGGHTTARPQPHYCWRRGGGRHHWGWPLLLAGPGPGGGWW